MPAITTAPSFTEALYRMGAMYGSAWRDGVQLADAVEVSGATEVGRIEVPLVGSTRTGYKPGRLTSEGTIRIQKMDTRWELEVWEFVSQSIKERRERRDSGEGQSIKPFQIHLEYDDPDALGIEKWQLDGCLLWRLPHGFSIADDLLDREFPFTWESETPIYAFRRGSGPGGVAVPEWYEDSKGRTYGPPSKGSS